MSSLASIEELLSQIDAAADPNVRAAANDLVRALMDFHGTAVARMIGMVDKPLALAMGRDDVVRPLLLLYDLHPESSEVRVRRAVDRIRNVEFVAINGPEVRIRLMAGARDVSREAIETAVVDAAPEIESVVIEDLNQRDFVPLENLLAV